MVKWLDNLLNSITMYRLMVYGLLLILAYGVILGFFEQLPYSGSQIIFSTIILYLTCVAANKLIAHFFQVEINPDSSIITSLILALIVAPVSSLSDLPAPILTGFLAMLSKYLLVRKKTHIFNPAAIALVIMDLVGVGTAVWWVGSDVMLPFVLLVGLAVVRKIRRFDMFGFFTISAAVALSVSALFNKVNMMEMYAQVLTSWPVFFFGMIMLTEPLTAPPKYNQRIVYGILVGVLFGSSFHFGPIFSTPELALVLGNIYSLVVSKRERFFLSVKETIKLAPNIFEFVFSPKQRPIYVPGQYMEWTYGHGHPDSRGVRRYFTIASSPTEIDLRIALRVDPIRPSSFKKSLLQNGLGETLTASHVAGDFVLPEDKSKELVWIAGGIGITPFRSMVKYLIDRQEKRSITLFYINKIKEDIVYKQLFNKASSLGLRVIYVLTETDKVPENWDGKTGRIDGEMIRNEVPDYHRKTYFLSGPSGMVDGYKKLLKEMWVTNTQIVTDYFPGY